MGRIPDEPVRQYYKLTLDRERRIQKTLRTLFDNLTQIPENNQRAIEDVERMLEESKQRLAEARDAYNEREEEIRLSMMAGKSREHFE